MTVIMPNALTSKTEAMVALLKEFVEIESPSNEKGPLDAMAAAMAEALRLVGGQVRLAAEATTGDHVVARWPGADGRMDGGIVVVCHHDTVHPVGGLAINPARIEHGWFYGPGSYDMKAALVQTVFALRALQARQAWPSLPVTVLCTSDEEVGSVAGRPLIEAHASRASLVLVMESVMAGWTVKTQRKGVGTFRVTVGGRAAHAGASHADGVNAIEEAAQQVLALQALTDYERGTTVNVGVVQGGTRNNVVPDQCVLEVDVRVTDMDAGQAVETAIYGLRPRNPKATVQVSGSVYRPPMERTAAVARAFEFARGVAAQMGIDLSEGGTGGGSDANWVSPLGVAVLDGLGPAGAGAHTPNERVEIASLAAHTALLASLISEWPGA